jgi:hypothetical protein
MSDALRSLESRVEVLEREVVRLREAILSLPERPAGCESPPQVENSSEEILALVRKFSLLPRIATVCFLLVIALILRTITDNEIVSVPVGSLMGMSYAALLIAIGWRKYRLSSPLAPVFAVCGGLLMFSIVVELHAGFHYLPSAAAYAMLFATGIALGTISYHFQVSPPILVGSLGICFAGIGIDFPNPHFPSLVFLLLSANLLGVIATRLHRCSWLRWIVLVVTMSIVQIWGLKLAHPVQGLGPFSPDWYLPLVFLVSAVFIGIAGAAVLRRIQARVARFDLTLPTITAAWAYSMACYSMPARWGSNFALGLTGLAAAACLLAFAVWLAAREKPGVSAFLVAGTVLLLIALPDALGNMLFALPPAAFYALILANYSRSIRNGVIRLTSYLVQLCACVTMAVVLSGSADGGARGVILALLAVGLSTAASLYHFYWCRMNPPAEGLEIFSRFDLRDKTAIAVFAAGLINGFLMLSYALYFFLQAGGVGSQAAFRGGQSILINVAAAALLWGSFRKRNREIRDVAVMVTIIGGSKVFLLDLFRFRGLPLVAAVFSFGVTLSLLSVLLARWQRSDEGNPAVSPGAGAFESHPHIT